MAFGRARRDRGDGKVLVLTRRKEETIIIGDSIEITVLGIRGEQVRLGISAPPDISVHRKEIYETLRGRHGRSLWTRLLGTFTRVLGGNVAPSRPANGSPRRNHRQDNRMREREGRPRPPISN